MAMNRILSLLMLSLCGLLLAGEGMAATLKFSTPTPPPHIMTKAANHFGKLLADATGNKMKVKVSPLNKLGNVPTVLSLLQSGAVQFAYVPAGDLAAAKSLFTAGSCPTSQGCNGSGQGGGFSGVPGDAQTSGVAWTDWFGLRFPGPASCAQPRGC